MAKRIQRTRTAAKKRPVSKKAPAKARNAQAQIPPAKADEAQAQISPEKARKALEADARRREQECKKAVDAVLKEHNCTLFAWLEMRISGKVEKVPAEIAIVAQP